MKDAIIAWLREKTASCGASGLVFGLSGGIDSCVVAALCREALGKKKVLALCLPCHSRKQDLRDALALAKEFDIRTSTVDLTESYDSMIRALPKADRMARANIRPRLRMTTLYYFAKKLNYLVCGTSNKTEFMSGYFTKFGDGASDLLPIGDLYKTQVRELARELAIPEHFITKPPTAGLWPGQTDEREMGITYPELDDILCRLEAGKKQKAIPAKVVRVQRMVAGSAHKRGRAEAFTLRKYL